MWHDAYVGWLEEARVALAAGLGYSACDLGIEMPVVSMRIDYRRALGDRVILESECAEPKVLAVAMSSAGRLPRGRGRRGL